MDTRKITTWIELSESAYAGNLAFFKERLPRHTEFSVVIKSNAYGHGMKEVATLAAQYGADSFCVHSLEEANTLRTHGFSQDILIMGPVLLNRLAEVISQNLRLVVYNLETIQELARLTRKSGKQARIHLKLETGTYRQGIDQKHLPEFITVLKKQPLLNLEGIYTHFANIEDTTDHDYAFYQLDLFNRMAGQVRDNGFTDVKCHTACSAALLLFPETYFNMVRLGLSQYGLWPSRETLVSYKLKHKKNPPQLLNPVLTWKCRVGQIKKVPASQNIGYGGIYQTTRDSRIAVLPIGYADGYDRGLSNQSHVLLQGRRAPVRGRICMNLIMVDITDIPNVCLEDEVTLLGVNGKEVVSADYLAGLCGTINYEFITRINAQIPRIVVK